MLEGHHCTCAPVLGGSHCAWVEGRQATKCGTLELKTTEGTNKLLHKTWKAATLRGEKLVACTARKTSHMKEWVMLSQFFAWDCFHFWSFCEAGKTVFVAAHGNSIRAIVKMIEGLSDDVIPGLEIPTGGLAQATEAKHTWSSERQKCEMSTLDLEKSCLIGWCPKNNSLLPKWNPPNKLK